MDQVTTYWELAIATYWGRIRILLDGDLLYRGRRLGQAGPAGLFENLADGVRWRGGTLSIRHRRSRAELLVQLDTPRSTTELTTRTRLTPGGVSQHLTALRHAGLVTSHRAGRLVLYARTTAAEGLITTGT